MENTTQLLSSPLTLLNPSPDDKENHPPLFTDFHTWDIIHYFDAKFETFNQYLLYLQQHLSDWQPDPHFQHFHTAYVHYRTMNDHIDSIGKTLKTMEKTRDNLKGTMNRLTPILHKKRTPEQDQIHHQSHSVTICFLCWRHLWVHFWWFCTILYKHFSWTTTSTTPTKTQWMRILSNLKIPS